MGRSLFDAAFCPLVWRQIRVAPVEVDLLLGGVREADGRHLPLDLLSCRVDKGEEVTTGVNRLDHFRHDEPAAEPSVILDRRAAKATACGGRACGQSRRSRPA